VARAYSDDLRGKILRAYERGRLGLEAVAEQFGVSYGHTKKIRRQQWQSGRMERPPQSRHGPVSRVTPEVEEQLRSELRRQPDLTLRELGERLEQSRQLRLSRTRLWEVLQRLGLRRKKIAPRHRAGRCAGTAATNQLLYLPPYSPDFNPIEQAWSKVKQLLRAAKARTVPLLDDAVTAALAAITPDNAVGWFRHCGYRIHSL